MREFISFFNSVKRHHIAEKLVVDTFFFQQVVVMQVLPQAQGYNKKSNGYKKPVCFCKSIRWREIKRDHDQLLAENREAEKQTWLTKYEDLKTILLTRDYLQVFRPWPTAKETILLNAAILLMHECGGHTTRFHDQYTQRSVDDSDSDNDDYDVYHHYSNELAKDEDDVYYRKKPNPWLREYVVDALTSANTQVCQFSPLIGFICEYAHTPLNKNLLYYEGRRQDRRKAYQELFDTLHQFVNVRLLLRQQFQFDESVA